MEDLDVCLDTFRQNLMRDRVHFQKSVDDLVSRRLQPSPATQQKIDLEPHQSRPVDVPYGDPNDCPLGSLGPDDIHDGLDAPSDMLGTRRMPEAFRGGQATTVAGSRRAAGPTSPPPKYGLPGLGQYDARRQKYQEEARRDYAQYMSQNASKPRRRADDANGAVDYEEVLARKRYQENNYRQYNDPSYNAGLLRPARSDSYLDKAVSPNFDYRLVPSLDLQPNVTDANNVQYNDQLRNGGDNFNPYNEFSSGYNTRPHSYPTDGNPNFDGYLPAAPYQGNRNGNIVVFNGGRRHSETGSPIGVTLPDHTSSHVNGVGAAGVANGYHAQLEQQMEETRRRRQDEKEEQLRKDKKLEDEIRDYDPWGRGGAGAPRRDVDGNVIAVRKQVGNGQVRRGRPEMAALSTAGTTAVDKTTGLSQPNYAIPRSPLHGATVPGPSGRRGAGDARQTLEHYQDDLKRQIEEKKQRDLAEKERERLEDERLMRKIREDNERMQREHSEEVKKQRMREEERTRRNEELQKRLEDQRRESKKKKRESMNRDPAPGRRAAREEEGPGPGRGQRERNEGRRSPPLPTVKSRDKVVERKSTVPTHKPVTTHLPTALQPVTRRPTVEPIDPSREHILAQLSTMRQQLEKEQQMMQQQLRQQMKNSYAVYDSKDKGDVKGQSKERNRESRQNPPSIYKRASKTNVKENDREPPHRSSPDSQSGMENYVDSSPTGSSVASRGSWQNHNDERKSDYTYDAHQPTRQKHSNQRNGSNRDDDVQEDSFLDEYMARNLPM